MKPLRILLLTFTYPPNKDGVSEASRTMAEGLAARGHEVTVGTTFLPERTEGRMNGVEVRHFRVTGSSAVGVGFAGETREYLDWVRAFTGDVIISHSWDCWTTDLARRAFAGMKARKILVSHGFTSHQVPWHGKFPWGLGVWARWQPYVWRLPWMLRRYDHVTVLSELRNLDRFFDHWMAHWTGYRQVSVIPNSADLPPALDAQSFRAAHGLGEGLVFLCVANFSLRKNQELALRAFRGAALAGAALVFIGSEFNDYSQRLQELDRQLGGDSPNRVLFLENLSRAATAAAFQECDVFVLSATAETQPIVLLEAMACGKPFISTDTGCVRTLPGGRVVGSEEAFAREMERLAEPTLRRTLGEEARAAFLRNYTPARVLEAYEKLLENLTTTKAASPHSPFAHVG